VEEELGSWNNKDGIILENIEETLKRFGAENLKNQVVRPEERTPGWVTLINKCCCCLLLVFFLGVRSFEFPIEIFLATCAIETLINEWDALWTKSNDGVHSLVWEGQEEESWRKFGIVVGKYQWVVRYWAMRGLWEAPFFCGFLAWSWGWIAMEIYKNKYMVGWNILPK